MTKILGLDLGTNSIGWAVIDDENKKILGAGVRIFPEGVINLGEGDNEISKNASRTAARGARRQFFRRRLRKRLLLKALAENNMCPINLEAISIWDKNLFSQEELKNWFKLNPYLLRSKALHDKVSLNELGRIFYHMIQRRGFLSNSRSASKDTEKGAIFKGDVKSGKLGINQTQEKIEKYETLGAYLRAIYPEEHKPFKFKDERIRNRYTTRQMYIDEFEKIWEKQKTFHKELTVELKTLLGGRKIDGYEKDGILFCQRPLRSQKHLVGKCTFEPGKTKCPASAIPFEEFRVYQWVNTVECNGAKLSDEDRAKVVDLLFSREKVKFKAIRKAIGKLDNYYQFNYKDDDPIVGTHTISNLSNKKFFGKAWFDKTEKEREDIWHVLYFFDNKTKLKEYAIKQWKFDEARAEKIAGFTLKDGYASLSRKAINNILPFLKAGFTYDVAVVLGGIKNAFAEDWQKLGEEEKALITNNIYDIVRQGKKGGFMEDLKKFLSDEFGLSEKQMEKLYHHSVNLKEQPKMRKLPVNKEADREIQKIRNPVVVAALFELRKVVNAIIDEYGDLEQIKVELARDLKVSKKKRNEIRREQKRLERENDRIKAELAVHGQRPTHLNILKYKLWEECDKTCPYTGRKISVSQLFSGEVQVEHIHPWSRSLNDSFMNKTLCFADENIKKGDKTPYEFYSAQGEEKWEEVKTRALNCFKNKEHYPDAYKKFKQFIRKNFDDDFVSRQLNDTRYISKEAKNYLSMICKDIQVSPGQMTANLRHMWGLNDILGEEGQKTRDDHRHHAIDALVMACATRSHLMALSNWNRYNRSYDLEDFPLPWETFRKEAEEAIAGILVSHKKTNRVLTSRMTKTKKKDREYINLGLAARGQLHKESVYGKRMPPMAQEGFHIRKPLESISTKTHVEKVVDPMIRKLLEEEIKEAGGYENGKDIPKGVFFEQSEDGQIRTKIFLPNKRGEPVPVKKVRIRENISGAERLKEDINQYVNPRKNHHVLIYKDEHGHLKEEVVTFWKAVKRKKQNQPLIQLPAGGVEVVTTLQINDMFLLGLPEEVDFGSLSNKEISKHLYRVQKFTSGDYYFRKHTESTLEGKLGEAFQYIKGFGTGKTGWQTFNPIKVRINAIGKVEPIYY